MERITHLRTLAKNVAKVVDKIPGVVAVATYGSLAEGNVDKFSDINLVAICSKIPEPENRRKILQKSYDWIIFKNGTIPNWRTSAQDFFFVKGENISITYKNKKVFEQMAEDISNNRRIGRDLFREIMTYVYNTRILVDSKNVIKKIRKKLPSATPQLLRYFLPDANKISLKEGWPNDALKHAIQKKNYIYIQDIIDLQIDNIIISLYVLNGKHYTSPKWAINSIREFKIKPKGTTKRLQEICRLGNKPEEVKRKVNLLQSLVADINKIILEKRVFDIFE